MRPVLHGDVVATARALLLVPSALRQRTLRHLFFEAEHADRYRRKSGQAHPVWGDGSLETAAAARKQAPEPLLDDADYCACMIAIFEELLRWRGASHARS